MNKENKEDIDLMVENQLKLQDSFRAAFDTGDGKVVLEYLKKKFFFDRTTQIFGVGGAENTAYNNGQRDVVNAIVHFIEADKETLIRRIQQNYGR